MLDDRSSVHDQRDARHPRSDTTSLTQRNLYILPSRPGLAFCATLLLLLLASINDQLSLGYLLTFLLTGAGLASMHSTHNNLRGLKLDLKQPAATYAGQPLLLDVRLHNTGKARYGVGMRLPEGRFADTAFTDVVRACADPARDAGWIDEAIVAAYSRLHELGLAHSVETWRDGELVGGLYGVCLGGLFAGESMFHRARDASKVALLALVEVLDDGREDRLLDVQWATPHLASLGVVEVPRSDYLTRLLPAALELPEPVWAVRR